MEDIIEESKPPDNKTPNGTSDIIWLLTDFSSELLKSDVDE